MTTPKRIPTRPATQSQWPECAACAEPIPAVALLMVGKAGAVFDAIREMARAEEGETP